MVPIVATFVCILSEPPLYRPSLGGNDDNLGTVLQQFACVPGGLCVCMFVCVCDLMSVCISTKYRYKVLGNSVK